VLYDRIRENKCSQGKLSIIEVVNNSITQTFTRSINTSVTTGICVLVILVSSIIFHINSITVFALPMFFGLISGCYSSICVAGIIWAAWEKRKEIK
jgi:SecD/SecF fusion protein